MRVLVTGAGGYTGSKLVELLTATGGIEVRGVVRPGGAASGLSYLGENVFPVDLAKPQNLDRLLDGVECIYHLAAGTSGSHFEMMMNTVVATDRLIEALHKHDLNRFVLVSSLSVYQMTVLRPGELLDEECSVETNLRARDPYTITKVRQENLVREKCRAKGIPLVVVRPGKIYGSGNHPIPPQLGLRIPGLVFLYIGGGAKIPLTHVSNCAEAIYLAGVREGIDGETINIVDDGLLTQREYMKLYEKIVGPMRRKLWVPYSLFRLLAKGFEWATVRTKGNIPPVINRYRAENLWKKLEYDNTKAKRVLDWKPRISVREGIAVMLRDFREKKGNLS